MAADISKAARLAIRHASEDGILPTDHGIEITEFDQAAKNSGADAVRRRLQREPSAVAVIGGTTTKAVEDLLPVVSANKAAFLSLAPADRTPFNSASAADTGATTTTESPSEPTAKPGTQKSVHLQLVADAQEAATTAAQRIDVSPGPVITLHDGSASGRAFIDTYIGVSAKRFVPTIEMGLLPSEENSFQKQAARSLTKSPRFIVFGGSAEMAANLALVVQAESPTTRIMTGGSNQSDCQALIGSFRDNDLCALGWNPVSSDKTEKAFREDFLAVYQRRPVGHAANAYRATLLVIAGLKPTLGSPIAKSGQEPSIRLDLNTRLSRTSTFRGMNIAFDENGRRKDNPSTVLVKRRSVWESA